MREQRTEVPARRVPLNPERRLRGPSHTASPVVAGSGPRPATPPERSMSLYLGNRLAQGLALLPLARGTATPELGVAPIIDQGGIDTWWSPTSSEQGRGFAVDIAASSLAVFAVDNGYESAWNAWLAGHYEPETMVISVDGARYIAFKQPAPPLVGKVLGAGLELLVAGALPLAVDDLHAATILCWPPRTSGPVAMPDWLATLARA